MSLEAYIEKHVAHFPNDKRHVNFIQWQAPCDTQCAILHNIYNLFAIAMEMHFVICQKPQEQCSNRIRHRINNVSI